MLVTAVGDEMCWWQLEEKADVLAIFVSDIHIQKVSPSAGQCDTVSSGTLNHMSLTMTLHAELCDITEISSRWFE